jgi:hypothetical protein
MAAPSMPEFYVDGRGNRRYRHALLRQQQAKNVRHANG